HHTHAPLATAALAAGCHVVIDKPFAVSADEARELAALAVRYERLAIPFQNRRWDADILTLQRLLREGALGTVHRFESRYERWRRTPKPRWTVEGEPGDYLRFYAGVQHALATGAPPPVSAAEAVAMMDVLEAARVSARERRVVELHAAGIGTADSRGRA